MSNIEWQEIEDYLNEHKLPHELIPPFANKVGIYIHWGDWKHEHLRCDYLMNEIGYKHLGEDIEEYDGGDAYSAIRYYARK